jgi:hypothetical protein
MSAIRPLIFHTIRRTTAMRGVISTARLMPTVRTMVSDASTAT